MSNEEAIKYLQQLYPQGGHCWLDEQCIEAVNIAVKAIKALLQKQKDDQDESDMAVIAHMDGVEKGKRVMKEQMMRNATEAYIRRNKYTKKNVLYGLDVTCDAIQKFNGGDKVKVIVIKED